jgi:hypothetical protein
MNRPLGKASDGVCCPGLSKKTNVQIVVLLAACLTPILTFAQSDNWLGGTGNWSDPSKWSAGVPTGSSSAFIDHGKAGASPVALDINGVATNLTIDSDDSLGLNDGVSLSIGASGGGTIANSGHLNINSTGTQTALIVVNAGGAGVMLTGGGTLSMSNDAKNVIGPYGGLLINVNNTMKGAGHIGNTQMGLNNRGKIDADIGGTGANPLIIDTTGTGSNTGTMEATNGGTLEVQASFNNTGGTIEASGTGSIVTLGPDTSFSGGTFTTSGGGVIGVTTTSGEHNATLEGITNTVTNAGMFEVFDGAALVLDGTINNTGTILMNGVSSQTLLDVSGPNHAATLTGKGFVTLSNNVNNVIGAFGGNLVNLNNTIQGAGQIGNTQMGLTNKGKIIANQPTTLIIDCSPGFSNPGTLVVNTGSLMNINDAFNNFSGTTLTGGSYMVTGTLQFNGANIVNDAAHITLTGASSAIIDQSSNDALRNFNAITSKGSLTLRSGKTLVTPGNLSNAGNLTVGAGSNLKVTGSYTQTAGSTTVDGTLTAPSGTTFSAGKVFGKGTIASTVVSSGSFTAGDSATLTGKLSPSTYTQNAAGSLNIAIGGLTAGKQYGQLAVTNGASLHGTLNVTLINNFVPAIGNTFTILTGSAVSGTFATVNGLSINSGEHFTISYKATSVTLTVVSGP